MALKGKKVNPEHLNKLEAMREKFKPEPFDKLKDHDQGLTSILYGLQTEFTTRFKNPIASIQLLHEVCNIDLLAVGDSITLTELYKAIYVLDNGPAALRHIIKAREKLRIINKIDKDLVPLAVEEMAEAETSLIDAAAEYYEIYFTDANQVDLANDLIAAVGRVYREFEQVNRENGPVAKYKQPWAMTIAQIVAKRFNCDVNDVLWKMPGEKVIAEYNQHLIEYDKASRPETTEEQASLFFEQVKNG